MNISQIKIFLLIIISGTFLSCKGQEKTESKTIETKSLEIGKTVLKLDDSIWVVFQDTSNNYWFGSNGKGLYHFDGKILRLITSKDGLIDNTIRGIQEDQKGNIYIETPDGISQFNGKTFTTLKVVKTTKNQWNLEPYDLWFGYNANDLYRFDGTSLFELKLPRKDLKKAFGIETEDVQFEGNKNSPYDVFGVNKDKDGNIWFGTETAGAFRYNGNSFLWFSEKELSTLSDGRVPGVRSMIQDKDGYFWLSNFYSKYKINPSLTTGYEKLKAVDLPEDIVEDKILYFNSGLTDKEGNLWMTTYGGGVWNYDGQSISNYEINNGKEDVLLISIFQDNNGIIWLGTDNDGAYTYDGETFKKFEPIR
ncbi:ligand-binding sensor domain-containing protein [Spongiivirga citrea]|uniref:Diguanylate cyclase n=1 Tax=Spongiivirga citrea TaxID=1481457 RepID=A0A6M0CJ26_9FLAO|nr:two-component regulator propeller domain-containing protein [Spongiivirga citrea]NER17562.1 hypothetical protein [Spongiivirga citrea]